MIIDVLFPKRVKIAPEQYRLIVGLAEDLGWKKEDIAYWLIEIGIMSMLMIRHMEGEEALNHLKEKIQNDKDFNRMSQLLESWWEEGKEKEPTKKL